MSFNQPGNIEKNNIQENKVINCDIKSLPNSMIQLYGEKEAKIVRDRCQEVDSFFGDWVTQYIYDILWELPPLNFLDKSLVTIVSLIVLGKDEQLQIHLKGILNLGKNKGFILSVLMYLKENNYLISLEKGLAILNMVIPDAKIEKINTINSAQLSIRERGIIKLAALVAIGDITNLKYFLSELLLSNSLSIEEIKGIFRHQMAYCGCPCTMNAFAVLNEVLKNRN